MKTKEPKQYQVIEEATENIASEYIGGIYQATPNFNNPYKIIDEVRKGVPKNKLIELSTSTGIDISEMAKLLHVSVRTIQRYADNDKLDSHISEHIMLIDRLYQKGYSMFRSPKDFNDWMKREQFGFQYQVPLSLLDTYSGIEAVYNKLGQFEHGIFA